MSLYDDYFTNEDKPFAENFNDALLLSNVFDLTVPIELPKMFNNSEWSTGTGQRKAGVSIIQTEGIDNTNITITNNSLIANNNATVLITVYPNFNQYGNLQKVYWEFEDGAGTDLTVDVLTEQRTSLLTNIPNNSVLSSVPYLQQLHKFILRLNFRSGTGIKKLGFIMQNKQQDRYGAEVGISDVNGLEDDLNSLESNLSSLNSNVTQKISNLNTEVWGSNTQTGNSRIDSLNTNYNNLRSRITNLESSVASLDTSITNLATRVKGGKVSNISVQKQNVAGYTVTHNLGRPNVPVVTLDIGNSSAYVWANTQATVYDVTDNSFKVTIFNDAANGNFGFNWVVVATD